MSITTSERERLEEDEATAEHIRELTAERDALRRDFEAYQLTAVEQFGLLQNERGALKAKVEADADVMAVCERLLEENRGEAELLAERDALKAELATQSRLHEEWRNAAEMSGKTVTVRERELRELREAAEDVCNTVASLRTPKVRALRAVLAKAGA